MTSVRKSLLLSFAERYSVIAIQFVSTMILARLLTPAETGIYSVGVVVVGFAHLLRDFGITSYLIQEKSLDTYQIRTAFTVTLIIGWFVGGIIFSLAEPVAIFYAESGLRNVIHVLAITFLFIPFGSIIMALLRREMEFGIIYRINTASAIIHALVAIICAARGHGFMSLAWASLVSTLVGITLAVVYRPSNAEFTLSLQGFKHIFAFGSYSSVTGLLIQLGLGAPDLVIGRILGFSAVGLYSRATGLLSVFNDSIMGAIQPVILPAFAREYRDDNAGLKDMVLKALSYIGVITWPIFIFLIFMSEPIINVLYGHQWLEAAPLVQILAVAFMVRTLTVFSPSILISRGKVEKDFAGQLILQVTRLVLIIVASFHSLQAVAITQIFFYICTFFVYNRLIRDIIHLSFKEIILATTQSIGVGFLCIAVLAMVHALGIEEDYKLLTLALLSLLGTWIVGLFALNHPFKQEIYRLLTQLDTLRWAKTKQSN